MANRGCRIRGTIITLEKNVFVGLHISKLIFDSNFEIPMSPKEKESYILLKEFNKCESLYYERIVVNMVHQFELLSCLISLKVQLFTHPS